ncbi:MAG: flagellar hook-associated protein FlgK [Phycisphaeraceae bacterium]|nr:flagellar hook-associated protein FlgK [Phycisphaeraceae bacterium]
MSLTAAMLIGRSALTASQLGIQVAGNNIANVSTPGYSRQVASFLPVGDGGTTAGTQSGRGVSVRDVRRQIDAALQNRLWNGAADESASAQQYQTLSAIEATLGELTNNDFSSRLQGFFNIWSERANLSKSSSVVVQQAGQITDYLRKIQKDLGTIQSQIDSQLKSGVERADQLLSTIANLNVRISTSEGGQGLANSLRDQRDQVISELSKLVDITSVDQPDGSTNILIGSTPVVLAGQSRGMRFDMTEVNGNLEVSVKAKDNSEFLDMQSGQLGALLSDRRQSVGQTSAALNSIASQLIFEVNKLHSTGTNKDGLTAAAGTLSFATADRTRSLNDVYNTATSNLPFQAKSGGFYVTVKQAGTSATQTVRVNVDLDGVDNTGAPGFSNDTSAEDIRAALGAIPGLTASFDAEGKLQVGAQSGFSFSFSDDSSGALALLGVNSFFTGTNASNIAVRSDLVSDPNKLQVGRIVDGSFVENGTALELSKLQNQALAALNGRTIGATWADTVQGIGVATAAAKTTSAAATSVRASLDAQRASISGVSIDEESLNLLNFQRQYQAGARLIDISNQLLTSLMQIV